MKVKISYEKDPGLCMSHGVYIKNEYGEWELKERRYDLMEAIAYAICLSTLGLDEGYDTLMFEDGKFVEREKDLFSIEEWRNS